MTEHTKLEKLVFAHPRWKALSTIAKKQIEDINKSSKNELKKTKEKKALAQVLKKQRQEILDSICEEIVAQLSDQELMQSVLDIYSQTVEEYTQNPHTQYITDDLAKFMLDPRIHNNARVLDIGCGPGRDSFFMFYNHLKFREIFMERKDGEGKTTLEKFGVPRKKFKTIGIDGSPEMIKIANKKAALLRIRFSTTDQPFFICKDIHNIKFNYPTEFDDYRKGKDIKKDMFVSHFFQKTR